MYRGTFVMYMYALSPVHVGGESVISGIADLPIQRERHTEFPMIQGQSLKGVLRSALCWLNIDEKCNNCKKKENPDEVEKCDIVQELFGYPGGIGGISLTDARILAFPVRALHGVFGWVTCPLVLERYIRDLGIICFGHGLDNIEIPKPEGDEKAIVCNDSNLIVEGRDGAKYIFIEDLQLTCEREDKAEKIGNIISLISQALPEDDKFEILKKKLEKDLVIVSDNLFREIVKFTTEVVARVRIDSTKGTVAKGGLWYEEYLPADTIMYSLIIVPQRHTRNISERLDKLQEKLNNIGILQVGGDETAGKGLERIKIVKGDELSAHRKSGKEKS